MGRLQHFTVQYTLRLKGMVSSVVTEGGKIIASPHGPADQNAQ